MVIEERFMAYFKSKWKAANTTYPHWPAERHIPSIDMATQTQLTKDVTDEEIWTAVRSLGSNRSPGIDGITASFFKCFWHIVGPVVCMAMKDYFESNNMPPQWKETLIVLIPKTNNADCPEKFRPISLCQSTYKIVAKILVGRLKGLLPGLISKEQGAFVPNRTISDHCLLAQEVINKFQNSTSILFSKATKSERKTQVAKSLGFRKVEEFYYLGVHLAMRKLIRADFDELLQKAKSKVNGWGNRHLSLAGRVTLMNSSLLALSTYLVTHTEVPRGVLAEIEKIGRHFLWDKGRNRRGLHYVSWEDICQPPRRGGLGFHAAGTWKGPLRARLAWSYITKQDTLGLKCLWEKYGDKIWVDEYRRGNSICWSILKDGAESLKSIIRWKVHNGSQRNVLDSTWILDIPISRWPTFINVNTPENMRVADLLDGNKSWDTSMLNTSFGAELVGRIQGIATHDDLQADCPELIHVPIGKTITAMASDNKFPKCKDEFKWIAEAPSQRAVFLVEAPY